MDQDHIKLANGKTLTRGSRRVGPRHDPYHREYVRMNRADGTIEWVLINCGLAGLYLEHKHTPEAVHCVTIDSTDGNLEEQIVALTGLNSREWFERVWSRRARSALRRDPDEWQHREDMREIDARILRYAM